MSKKGPLVRVELEPGRFVKMYKEDARAQGLLAPKKERRPTGDKARRPENDKARRPDADKASTRVLIDSEEPEIVEVTIGGKAEDLTVVDGIGEAAAAMLHECGILTLDELRAVETCDLPARVARAIERWRDGGRQC
jgi:predicted flap endonuclease-1-like 5' DNA nuclease